MASRIRLGIDETIPVPFSYEERDLILVETMIDPDLQRSFRAAEVDGDRLLVPLTLSDVEDLMGHVAAVVNHTDDRQVERKLGATWERLRAYEDRYEDELSAPRGGWQPRKGT
ncbi:MAG: hypothetical protein D6773_16415 [Alphaproteobacteria bacterium]|nr:MAG: hypothetical protein D6773_16415 [Alphaproteobacteria bacterium]